MEGPLTSSTAEALAARIGTEIGVSRWIRIDQTTIDTFANLTLDTYFIHTNPERAKQETPFGGAISHGFLTLSMLSTMAYEICPWIEKTKTGINYGFNRLRFVAPVPSGAQVRGRFVLKAFDVTSQRWQATWDVTVEIENQTKPAIVAEWITAGLY